MPRLFSPRNVWGLIIIAMPTTLMGIHAHSTSQRLDDKSYHAFGHHLFLS